MATIVTRYISAGSTAGGDGTTTALSGANRAYASIDEWVTARVAANANFVTANVIEKGVCLPDAEFDVSVNRPNLAGATTDSTHYWWLTASVRSTGIPGAGVVLNNHNLNCTYVVRLTNNYSVIDSLEIKNIRGVNDTFCYFVALGGTGNVAEGLFLHDGTTGGAQRQAGVSAFSNSNASQNCIVRNCIIQNINGFVALGINQGDAGGWTVTNNTIVNIVSTGGASSTSVGISCGSRASLVSQNNLALNCTGGVSKVGCFANYGGGSFGTLSYCVSTDTTATGTGSIPSVTATNEITNATVGSENCHLKLGAQSINAGTTLTLATDITNNVRPQGASWDIGADEYIAAATVAITRTMRLFEGFRIKLLNGRLIIQQKQ